MNTRAFRWPVLCLGVTLLAAVSSLAMQTDNRGPHAAPAPGEAAALGLLLTTLHLPAQQLPSLAWEPRSDWINVKTDATPRAMGDGLDVLLR